jgi:hypothetical protein
VIVQFKRLNDKIQVGLGVMWHGSSGRASAGKHEVLSSNADMEILSSETLQQCLLLMMSSTKEETEIMIQILVFCLCDKIPEIINLRRRKVYFGSQLQSFLLWLGPLLWACGEAEHHNREHMAEQTTDLMSQGKQRESQGRNVPFKVMSPVT